MPSPIKVFREANRPFTGLWKSARRQWVWRMVELAALLVIVAAIVVRLSPNGENPSETAVRGRLHSGAETSAKPIVSILYPADLSVWAAGEIIAFSGTAAPGVASSPTAGAFAWVSSRDGQLHGGSLEFETRALSLGEHAVTLSATGPDGDLGTSVIRLFVAPPPFTRLDADGKEAKDPADWAMVLDNRTGLMWEVKHHKDGVENYADPNDADNTYIWRAPLREEGGDGEEADTDGFIRALNDARHGGYGDWRLPAIHELEGLAWYGAEKGGPAVYRDFFPDTQASFYWSATTRADDPGRAWGMGFSLGDDYCAGKAFFGYARAVRGREMSQPDRFIVNGDGTVTDIRTGLMWQQGTAPGRYSWREGLAYARTLELAGHADWRLPTLKELRALLDQADGFPAIDLSVFPETSDDFYWSATTFSDNTGFAWGISLYYRGANDYYKDFQAGCVRAVRCGRAGTMCPWGG